MDRLFDKVLVDAQCTHDGSIKHIKKVNLRGMMSVISNFLVSTKWLE